MANTTIKPIAGIATINTANPNRDGSGAISEIVTGSNLGTIITNVTLKAENSVTSGMIRFFVRLGGAPDFNLIREIIVSPTEATPEYPTYNRIVYFNNLSLEAGDTLAASTEQGEVFQVYATGYSIIPL